MDIHTLTGGINSYAVIAQADKPMTSRTSDLPTHTHTEILYFTPQKCNYKPQNKLDNQKANIALALSITTLAVGMWIY